MYNLAWVTCGLLSQERMRINALLMEGCAESHVLVKSRMSFAKSISNTRRSCFTGEHVWKGSQIFFQKLLHPWSSAQDFWSGSRCL